MKWTKKEALPLARKVHRAFTKGLTKIPRGQTFTTKQACGKDFWDTLDHSERCFAGRFISIMVNAEFPRLDKCAPDSSNHLRYRRF